MNREKDCWNGTTWVSWGFNGFARRWACAETGFENEPIEKIGANRYLLSGNRKPADKNGQFLFWDGVFSFFGQLFAGTIRNQGTSMRQTWRKSPRPVWGRRRLQAISRPSGEKVTE